MGRCPRENTHDEHSPHDADLDAWAQQRVFEAGIPRCAANGMLHLALEAQLRFACGPSLG
jgi:hypothetical protein